MLKKISIISLYSIAIIILVIYAIIEITPKFALTGIARVIILCSSCTCLYFAGLFLSKYKKNNKPMKINLWIFFILYVMLFITLTLFDGFYGRRGFTSIHWTKDLFRNYMQNSMNLIPFKTIIGYMRFTNNTSIRIIITNIVGNIIACMPFAFFLPLLFKRQNDLKFFTLTMILIVLIIELLQFITLSGSFDIDDLILYVFGAVILYLILKIKKVNQLIHKIFLNI